jgi:hypothetical protein
MSTSQQEIIKRYVPEEYVAYVIKLLQKHPVSFRIVKPRKTKLGDFRVDLQKEKKYSITINGDLNVYSFLITTIHEFAHLVTHEKHGRFVRAHGKEWKHEFKTLLEPLVSHPNTPNDIKEAVSNSMHNLKASSCTQIELQRVLMRYDQDNGLRPLEGLNKNSIFDFNGRQFAKGNLRRTRFMCKELISKRMYLINSLAMVKELKDE